jgi:hypothetical protein
LLPLLSKSIGRAYGIRSDGLILDIDECRLATPMLYALDLLLRDEKWTRE